jgi:phage terminase large subunit
MMSSIKVNVDEGVFNKAFIPYLDCMSRIQLFYGGASSGKSVFLAQRDIIDVMKGGRNFLICRQVGRTLRGSVIQELVKVISEWGLNNLFSVNKTDGTITCNNGYQIIFAGLDDVEKLKSLTPAKGVFTDIRVEEATETERSSIKQLLKRQRGGDEKTAKRLTLSFNPIIQDHWIYKDYFSPIGWADSQKEYNTPELFILKTTYLDNRFLTKDDIHDLESETDEYFKNVYTLGLWGVLGNVIFKNWIVEDLSEMQDQFVNRRNGLDFGFSSDPAALFVSHYNKSKKTIYIFDELYERGLTNDILAGEVKRIVENDLVICDSAEPKSIAELRQHGVNARGAKKGKDSVDHGIQWLQQQKIIIDTKCINTQNEFRQYKWKEDSRGNAMRIPVDFNNHLIDAGRYAYEADMVNVSIGGKAKVGNYIQ